MNCLVFPITKSSIRPPSLLNPCGTYFTLNHSVSSKSILHEPNGALDSIASIQEVPENCNQTPLINNKLFTRKLHVIFSIQEQTAS